MSSICGNCGSINSYQNTKEGGRSVLIFLLLCLFMIVPGLLYWGFKSKAKNKLVCADCGAENQSFGLNTPRGIQLYKQYHPEGNLNLKIKSSKSQTWHGFW